MQALEMKELTQKEIEQVNGGWFMIAFRVGLFVAQAMSTRKAY